MSLLIIGMLFVYTIACLFLIMVILLQSGDKGGGLSSLGGASQGLSDALGATGAERTFNKVTTLSACTFIVLAVALSFFIGRQAQQATQLLPEQAETSAPLTGESGVQAGDQAGTAAGAPGFEIMSEGIEIRTEGDLPPAGQTGGGGVSAPQTQPGAVTVPATPPDASPSE